MSRRPETAKEHSRRANGDGRAATAFAETSEETVGWRRSPPGIGDSDSGRADNEPTTLNLSLAHVVCCVGIPLLIVAIVSAGVLGGLLIAGLAAGAGLTAIAVRARLRRSGMLGCAEEGCGAGEHALREPAGDSSDVPRPGAAHSHIHHDTRPR